MFFERGKVPSNESREELTRRFFGGDARYLGNAEGQTEVLVPELRAFGENVILEDVFEASVAGHRFCYASAVKVYRTAWDRSFHHYRFYGSALRVQETCALPPVYAYTGSPFPRPAPMEGWSKCGKVGSLRVYTRGAELSPAGLEQLKAYCRWLDGGLCTVLSYHYALYCEQDHRAIFFWQPDLYPHADMVEIVKEEMETHP